MRHSVKLVGIGAALLSAAAFGDLIDFKDGRSYSGTLSRNGDNVTIKTDDGQTVNAKNADILRVTVVGLTVSDKEAATEWGRVQVRIKDATDIQAVLDLVQKFIDKYGSSAAGSDAADALKHYKEISTAGGVKFRGKWITAADKVKLLQAWRDAAQPALDAYLGNKLRDALDASKAVVEKDKENSDALAIAGLASFRLANFGPARNFFNTLATLDSSTPLAENNIGAICCQQKQYAEGLAHFYKALQIMPDQRTLLDNITEGINAYLANNGDKNATAYLSLKKVFDPAEKRMETTMAKQEMVRNGSTWITKQDADKNKTAVNDLKKKMSTLETQYQKAKADITRLENQIKQAQNDYNSALDLMRQYDIEILQARTRTGSDNASLVQARNQVAQTAARAQQQGQQAVSQRDQIMASSKDLFAQRDAMTAQMAALSANFPGTYHMIELDEGDGTTTPLPSTQPATRASTRPATTARGATP